ncbi:hypothetical protein CAOG_01220 [Capsaspora owczarzaki ATCC 30864]|uniref:Glycoside hydrolase family 31 TIM barrel domain-containing protein n=1 Tax=Capsaspora owczarzaki (strain ATCC 30864) TaxID=595528 RepID=A0A0D2U3J3_CAPO3|nr:hypothetical protein CAOG_01220 [Capsaspora owczarzaki ATCC 30864]KJE89796.1 hypothetical protein CAOG_001220 [Capsaspora owczarzaki ATCC 30864]|eukprot:XP_004349717.1 hypothetical protein CAOG_01220 [Capsaspora owczarzaki ATCC 30864]
MHRQLRLLHRIVLALAATCALSAAIHTQSRPALAAAVSSDHQRDLFLVPPVELAAAPYADWAHSHWVWLASGPAGQNASLELVQEYLDRQIRVGGYDIDSGWATSYTTFEWDTKKYPDPQALIDSMHAQGVRVILWATSTIAVTSPLYNYTSEHGYLLKHLLTGKDAIIHYWHGDAAYIDYTNPDAVAFYHSLMDNQLKQGYDGWKNDGTDPFLLEVELEGGILAHKGVITEREYANLYYTDFFEYSRQVNGNVTLCMNRPYDSYENYVYWRFAPRDVVFSGWVGDEDPTFEGLQDALKNMIYSAANNYVSFGSDIGGYRLGDNARTIQVLLRWAQLGAFVGLMENGGDGEHRPWGFNPTDNSTTDIYRTFVDAHYEIAPYLLSLGAQAYASGSSIMRPYTDQLIDIVNFDYSLGSDLFVSPIVDNTTSHTVNFPRNAVNASDNAIDSWVYWFDPTAVHQGGTTGRDLPFPLSQYPVYKRVGAVIPIHLYESALAPSRVAWSNTELPILAVEAVWPQGLAVNTPAAAVALVHPHAASVIDRGVQIALERPTYHSLQLQVSASPRPFIARITGVDSSSVPRVVLTSSGLVARQVKTLEDLLPGTFHLCPARGVLHVRLASIERGEIISVDNLTLRPL